MSARVPRGLTSTPNSPNPAGASLARPAPAVAPAGPEGGNDTGLGGAGAGGDAGSTSGGNDSFVPGGDAGSTSGGNDSFVPGGGVGSTSGGNDSFVPGAGGGGGSTSGGNDSFVPGAGGGGGGPPQAGGATPKDGDHAGLDGFVWFFGVVEDRNDPLNAGRVRVRAHAFNTGDKSLLPTNKLPWAQCMMPSTSASIGGIGSSATGLLEGSFVLGFYTDGKNRQLPMILGSLPGIASMGSGSGEAFSDPKGVNPLPGKAGKADTPSLAIVDEYSRDSSTIKKFASWSPDISVASRHRVTKVGEDKSEDKYPALDDNRKIISDTWSEPLPRGDKPSAYPYNHVTKTESGHVFEVDDTKGGERIHQFHRTGTFYEIQPDGNRVTKVIGSDYEIVIKDKNVYIQGACNVTIKGDVKMLCEGDLVQEVNKNYHLTVHGDMITKIGGNHLTEISSDRSTNVDGKDSLLITKDSITTIGGKCALNIGEERKTMIGAADVKIVTDTDTTVAKGGINFSTPKSTNVSSIGDLNFAAMGNIAIKSLGTFKLNVEGNAYQTYKGQSHFMHTGNAFSTYEGESHFRHQGHFKFYYGADTSKDFAAGTDHVAPSPARSSDSTRNTATAATSS